MATNKEDKYAGLFDDLDDRGELISTDGVQESDVSMNNVQEERVYEDSFFDDLDEYGNYINPPEPEPEPVEEDEAGLFETGGKRAYARGKSLLGDLFGAGQKFSESLEENFPMLGSGIIIDADGISWANGKEFAAKRESGEIIEPLESASEYWKEGVDDVEEKHSWEGLKQKFKDGDITGGMKEVILYGTETGIASIPDMIAVVANMPAYVMARSNEMGDIRAENKGKEKADITDYLEAVPGALGSALFERFGVKGITDEAAANLGKDALKHGFLNASKNVAKGTGRAASKEAFTEFVQEGIIEYTTEKLGTGADMSLAEAADRGAAGAVGGGVYGGGAGGAGAVYKQFKGEESAEPPGPLDELDRLNEEREINSQKYRDGEAMREHQDQVRESVAARGGDALEQEVAAAEAGVAKGEELSSNIANMSRLLAQRQAVDEEAAYMDEQVKEDEARAKIQSEAADRYAEGIKQVERDKQAATDKKAMATSVESRSVAIKETAVAEEGRQAEAKTEAAAKTLASEKADQKLNKLRKRRQALGLDPKGDVEGVSPYPSAQEVEAFKGEKQKSSAMAEAFTAAANEAATSPTNDVAPPTKNQLEQGNYKKGHPRVNGLGITIESPAGSTRTAVDGSWSQDMKDDYGYIKGTESAEGKTEQLDVFVGKDHESDSVFIVDQVNKEGAFDEHKVMMSYPNAAAARKAYLRNYPKGFKLGPVSTLSVAEFKEWLKNGDQTVPYSGKKLAGTPKATSATTEQVEEVIQDERARKGRRRSRILFRQGDKSTSDTLAKDLTRPEKEGGGGYSVDENTGERVTDGYSVGQGIEEIIDGHATPEQIEAFRRKYAKELKKKGNTLGGWYDETDGKTYLDVSVNVKDRAQAVALGKKNSERAIQDLKKGGEGTIRLDQEKTTRMRVDEEAEAAPEGKDGSEYFSESALKEEHAQMTPADFLSLAETLRFANPQKEADIRTILGPMGEKLSSLPILTVKDGKVIGHEGRHRALELQARGVKTFPVRIIGTRTDTLTSQDGKRTIPVPGTQQGRNFKDFFSAITKGLAGKSSTGKAYTPVIPIEPTEALGKFSSEYAKYRGNFDDHIAFSIPGFKEVQILVGSALATVYGKGAKILDIGASEGSFAKAITAVSGAETVALDPNPDMRDTFNKTPVDGAEYAMEALGSKEQEGQPAWDEDDGTPIAYFDPQGQKFDVIHEAMVFQFISPDRQAQISRVKQLLKANGVAIFEEKMFTEQQKSNETKKNAYKRQYFEQAEMTKKAEEVLEGMDRNTVHQHTLEETLTANFDNVVEFWDSGNFKGYVVSDSAMAANRVVSAIGNTNTEFSNTATPRKVTAPSTLRLRKDGAQVDNQTAKVKVKVDKAEADVAIAELNDKLPGMKLVSLENVHQLDDTLFDQVIEDFGVTALGAKGIFDEKTGNTYVFSDNHKTLDDLISTAMHEGVGHKGLRVLFDQAQMDAILDSVYAGADKAALSRIADKYNLDLTKVEDQRIAADEFIAETAEKNIDAPVLKRVVDAIRQVLRDLGILETWTDSDIKNLLRRNRSALKRGRPLSKISLKVELELEETGEVIPTEQVASIALRHIDKRIQVVEKLRGCVS